MQKKYIILVSTFFAIATFCTVAYFKFTEKNDVKIDQIETQVQLSSDQLVEAFYENEMLANNTYVEKAIEIEGKIKEVTLTDNRYTIILHSDSAVSSLICEMKSAQSQKIRNLEVGQKVILKGICKGFLKDVIFLDCMIVNSPADE